MAEATFDSLVEDLEKFLEFERDNGVKRMEVDRAVLAALTEEPSVTMATEPEPVALAVKPIPTFETLDAMASHISTCTNCPLARERTCAVSGAGNARSPDIMFIGEGPSEEDDAQGQPFVGKAGQLLTKIIEAMGYQREQVFITTIVKCRPPNNRAPLPEEMAACLPYMKQQIEMVKPKVIVAMGASTVKGLLGRTMGIMRLRGKMQSYDGMNLMPTFSPSYLLRDPSKKKEVWLDLQVVMKKLGKEPPARKK